MGAWASLISWKNHVLNADILLNKMHCKFQPCKKPMPIFLSSPALATHATHLPLNQQNKED